MNYVIENNDHIQLLIEPNDATAIQIRKCNELDEGQVGRKIEQDYQQLHKDY